MFNPSDFNMKRLLFAVLVVCSVEGIHFDCIYFLDTPAIGLGSRYTCAATIINSDSTSLENVTGNHRTGKSNEDVEYLWIWRQNLPFIPENLADFFENLDALWIENSSLASINANDLRPFPGLVFLNLWLNQLSSIDGDLFKYTPHLQSVSFSRNQIKHIGHDLVTNLQKLRHLGFQDNVCIDEGASTPAEVLLLAPQLSVLCPPI